MIDYPNCPLPREINVTSLISAFRIQREQDYYFNGETHDFYEVVYVVEGTVGVTAGDRVLILEQGQCILHPPGEFHRLWSEECTQPELIILSFQADITPQNISGRYYLSPTLRIMIEEWMEENKSIFIHDDIWVTDIHDFIGARRQLSKLELFLAELFSTTPDLNQLDSANATMYTEIVRLMQDNLHQSLTIDQLCSLCHMSKSNLKRLFSRYAGMGVISYFNQMKINRACQLLWQGETVGNTAKLLGFTDQNYFSTVFKRITGLSPSTFAKQAKE